jgi:mercuric ion binding protein
MKFILNLTAVLFFGLFIQTATGQVVTEKFWVGGVCDMCKERIETTLDTKGVKMAEYDLQTNTLEVTYASNKISSNQIHKLLNAKGHDTSKSKASDESYDEIHGCCKYREAEKSSCSKDCTDIKCDDKKDKKSCADKDCKDKDCKDKKGKKEDDHDHDEDDDHGDH